MKLVGNAPTITIASSGTTLATGNTELADVTVAASSKGNITLLSLPIVIVITDATLHSEATAGDLIVERADGSVITTTYVNTAGGTTTGATDTIYFTGGLPISAGTSQTLRIFENFTVVGNTHGAHTSAATLSLGSAYTDANNGLVWIDTGGNASATTATDIIPGSTILTSTTAVGSETTISNKYFYSTTTPGFFYNYPTTTVGIQS
jgi:hypothetical protein